MANIRFGVSSIMCNNELYTINCPICHRTSTYIKTNILYAVQCKYCNSVILYDGTVIKNDP